MKTPKYGIALDIGTTTLAGALIDLKKGSPIASCSLPNPQRKWGSDVISRINAIKQNPALLKTLKDEVVETCNEIITELASASVRLRRSDRDALIEISAAGNTVMQHIFLGVSPVGISRAPYKPAFKEAKRLKALAAGLKAGDETLLYVFPSIGGFAGGDAVSVALSLGFHKPAGVTLAIDIGTNSEIILSTPDGLFVTSAAAGPAFEGGEIRCGMTARKGAISEAVIKGDELKLTCIDGVAPAGICGSGAVSLISELIEAGVIESSGRIKDSSEVPTLLSTRIKRRDNANAFIVYRDASTEIALFQDDVRALQTAKAAMRAGINVLLEKARVAPASIGRVYIAGAFGSSLKKERLHAIGLLDKKWLKGTISIGDAVLDGARLTIDSDEYKARAEELALKARYVPLSGSRFFEEEFIKNMDFKN